MEEKSAPFANVDTGEGMSVSDPSDISAGETPGSPSKTTETLVALGTVGAAGAAAAAVYHSESDTTDDDKKQLISSQKKKRSWAGRFLRRKNQEKEKVTSSSLALQEDSSVSSWSKGEDSSPDTTLNIYGATTKPLDDMPAEMRVFGEDHGLAAAEHAMMEEDEKKRKLNEVNKSVDESEAELSQKSSGSLRDELDKAIESGDWAAVEKQTNQMLDEDKHASNLLSEIESDVDSEVMENWSRDEGATDYESEAIDDDRIEMLEKLIETDDWQGIVDDSQIHTKTDAAVKDD